MVYLSTVSFFEGHEARNVWFRAALFISVSPQSRWRQCCHVFYMTGKPLRRSKNLRISSYPLNYLCNLKNSLLLELVFRWTVCQLYFSTIGNCSIAFYVIPNCILWKYIFRYEDIYWLVFPFICLLKTWINVRKKID